MPLDVWTLVADVASDSSEEIVYCGELEQPETREQRDRSAHHQTHRRAHIRGGRGSSEEEHQGEGKIHRADPAK